MFRSQFRDNMSKKIIKSSATNNLSVISSLSTVIVLEKGELIFLLPISTLIIFQVSLISFLYLKRWFLKADFCKITSFTFSWLFQKDFIIFLHLFKVVFLKISNNSFFSLMNFEYPSYPWTSEKFGSTFSEFLEKKYHML